MKKEKKKKGIKKGHARNISSSFDEEDVPNRTSLLSTGGNVGQENLEVDNSIET